MINRKKDIPDSTVDIINTINNQKYTFYYNSFFGGDASNGNILPEDIGPCDAFISKNASNRAIQVGNDWNSLLENLEFGDGYSFTGSNLIEFKNQNTVFKTNITFDGDLDASCQSIIKFESGILYNGTVEFKGNVNFKPLSSSKNTGCAVINNISSEYNEKNYSAVTPLNKVIFDKNGNITAKQDYTSSKPIGLLAMGRNSYIGDVEVKGDLTINVNDLNHVIVAAGVVIGDNNDTKNGTESFGNIDIDGKTSIIYGSKAQRSSIIWDKNSLYAPNSTITLHDVNISGDSEFNFIFEDGNSSIWSNSIGLKNLDIKGDVTDKSDFESKAIYWRTNITNIINLSVTYNKKSAKIQYQLPSSTFNYVPLG
ncbi:hypothetical protein [Spiroplasma endosymbiont of Aspidapion aeneum]|uniref:hypothetical protein n=1 Tax=Spiroplasma endosymbiont of Aspidapion aeneum TaxID=3066276 RepID=UPI00313CEE0C